MIHSWTQLHKDDKFVNFIGRAFFNKWRLVEVNLILAHY